LGSTATPISPHLEINAKARWEFCGVMDVGMMSEIERLGGNRRIMHVGAAVTVHGEGEGKCAFGTVWYALFLLLSREYRKNIVVRGE